MEDIEKSRLISNFGRESSGRNRSNKISTVKGIAAMLGFTFMAAISRICVQMLEKTVPDFELNTIRCGSYVVCMALYFAVTKTWPTVKRENWTSVGLLAIFSNLCTLTLFIAVTMIPLTSFESVFVTSQAVTSLIIFRLINKETTTWEKLLGVPVCSAGVILVLQPPFIFGGQHHSDISTSLTNYTEQSSGYDTISPEGGATSTITPVVIGYILSVATGLSNNMISSVTKYYSEFYTNENIIISLAWATLFGTIFSAVVMLSVEEPTFPTNIRDLALVIGHTFAYLLINPLFCYGSILISGSLGAIIRSLNLLFVLAAQYLLMKDIFSGHRNWIEVFGVILVLFGAIFSSIVELVNEKDSEKNS